MHAYEEIFAKKEIDLLDISGAIPLTIAVEQYEGVTGKLIHFGHLIFIHTVFNGQRMQSQRGHEDSQLFTGGITEIEPEESIVRRLTEHLLQMLKSLGLLPGCQAEVATNSHDIPPFK